MTDHLDIHDLVEDLTRTHQHREPYVIREAGTTWTRGHVTLVPSLIDQLQTATAANTGETGRGGYQSRPAAFLESMDTLIHIDLAAARWIRDLGEDDHHTDTAATVRQLHGLWPSSTHCKKSKPKRDSTGNVTCCTRHTIEHDIRSWWTQARVITGWDTTAWRPDNTCPACTKRGALRVRFATQSAMCIQCRTTWTPEVIGLLADHIRLENAEDQDTNDTAKTEGACA